MKFPLFRHWIFLATFISFTAPPRASAQVAINEIFYHPPSTFEGLRWIELHNSGAQAVDISGWTLSKAAQYRFPANTSIAGGGYIVVASDSEQFQRAYGALQTLLAPFENAPQSNGGTAELRNSQNNVVDTAAYDDRPPWPVSPDSGLSSLEKITPGESGEAHHNWAPSVPLASKDRLSGTPGKRNSNFLASLPPVFQSPPVLPSHVLPNQPIPVKVNLQKPAEAVSVVLKYWVQGPTKEVGEQTLPMTFKDGAFVAEVPAQKAMTVVRVQISAEGKTGAKRIVPSPNDLRPAFSVLVTTNFPEAKVPLVYLLGSASGGNNMRNQPSQEDQMRWGFQQRFQIEANLYDLWGRLALSNALNPGQLVQLRTVLKTQMQARNQTIRKTLDVDTIASQERTVTEALGTVRRNAVAALNAHLTPDQAKAVEGWEKGAPSAPTTRGGFDVHAMLRNWVNLEMQFLNASIVDSLNEEKHRLLRQATLDAIGERDALSEMAKTAFQNPENRGKFEGRVNRIRKNYDDALGKILSSQERSQRMAITDEALMFRIRQKSTSNDKTGPVKRNALVYVDPKTREPKLFDFVNLVNRKAGWKVHFPKGNSLNKMTGINLIFEDFDRFVLTEWYAYEVYRDSGNAAPLSEFVRLHLGDQTLGYHLLIEQPNKSFLRRNKLNADGNLYKLGWQGNTVTELHEKKTHPQMGHEDLESLLKALGNSTGAAQWEIMKKEFDLPQVMTYFAVNSLLAHWDGFMNNYFTYHDTRGTGKWQLYPWDQDKTMGFHDGTRGDSVFIDLPLNFGATGDAPPGWKGTPPLNFFEVYRRYPNLEWWRQPGPFSGPLIAHPEFKKHYAARIKSLLETSFSEKTALARLSRIQELLGPEVGIRAVSRGHSPQQDIDAFQRNLEILKKFINGRRAYLLGLPEIKSAGVYDPKLLQ